MNEVRSQAVAEAPAASRLLIADGDIHPAKAGAADFHPWLEKRWRDHIDAYGAPGRQGWQVGPAYPKSQPNASRRDAYPPEGGRPGSSLAFMQRQHLDANGVGLGILNPLGSGQGVQNPALSAALCHATNEWQLAEWTSKDSRLKASVVVPYEDAVASAAEIRRYADNPAFVQVLMLSRTAEPLGSRKYWPIYEAAAEVGMPVGVHAFGYGGNPVTPGGWPSYYIEEMTGHSQCQQAGLTSLIVEGVFEKWPSLKMVMKRRYHGLRKNQPVSHKTRRDPARHSTARGLERASPVWRRCRTRSSRAAPPHAPSPRSPLNRTGCSLTRGPLTSSLLSREMT